MIRVATPTMSIVARSVSWRILARVVGEGTWLASLLILAILLPPGAFGVIAVATVIVAITTLLTEAGIGARIVVSPNVGMALLKRSAIRTALVGVAFSLGTAALAEPIIDAFARGADPDILRVMAISVTLAALSIVPLAVLKKTLDFKRIAMVTVGAALIASAAAILAGALGAGVWALVVRLLLYQLLLTTFAWAAAAKLLPRRRTRERAGALPAAGASWFVVVAMANFLAHTFDNLIVGYFTNVTQLGLYALAFSLAYAPLKQISWTIGAVLFPAIAVTRDPAVVARRTAKSMRLMSLVLLPLVPAAIALAPALIPTLLGEKWAGMVGPFQILIVMGVGQGMLNVVGETLSASGNVALRGRIDMAWAVATMLSVAVGAGFGGIQGAALAHIFAFVGLAAAYILWGGPRIGLSPGEMLRVIGGVTGSVGAQAGVTAAVAATVTALGGGALVAGVAGAALGLATLMLALRALAPLAVHEAREVLTAMLRRRSPTAPTTPDIASVT